jgi:hypothetical protein
MPTVVPQNQNSYLSSAFLIEEMIGEGAQWSPAELSREEVIASGILLNLLHQSLHIREEAISQLRTASLIIIRQCCPQVPLDEPMEYDVHCLV